MSAQDIGKLARAGEGGSVALIGKQLNASVFEKRRLRRQLAGVLVFGGEFARFHFAGFDIGLIEGVDADDGTGDGGGDFPAKKFLADRVGIGNGDADDRMACLFDGGDGGVLRLVWFGGQPKVSENAIVAVELRLCELFTVDGNDALADFSCGFGNELFEPGAEIEDARRGDDGEFVAAVFRGDAKNRAKNHAGIGGRRGGWTAGLNHFLGELKKFRNVKAHDGGGDHAEIRKGGITTADAGHAVKNAAELTGFRHLLHFGARIGDGDEAAADFAGADLGFDALKKILLEDVRLEGTSRFAGNDAERFFQIEFFLEGFDLGGISGVQDMQLRKTGDFAEGHTENFRAKAGAAHAEQKDMLEFGGLDFP